LDTPVPLAQVYGDSAYYETGPSASRAFMSSEERSERLAMRRRQPRHLAWHVLLELQRQPQHRARRARAGADLGFVPPFHAELR
jgi:hypothetical protein